MNIIHFLLPENVENILEQAFNVVKESSVSYSEWFIRIHKTQASGSVVCTVMGKYSKHWAVLWCLSDLWHT